MTDKHVTIALMIVLPAILLVISIGMLLASLFLYQGSTTNRITWVILIATFAIQIFSGLKSLDTQRIQDEISENLRQRYNRDKVS